MPSPYLYYTYPFGQNADDLSSIPMNAAVDGSVSYYAGWTDPYEYNLLTNPAALPIPRGQMNQLFYDITNNLQQYQQYGTPFWVTGNTVSYPIYSRVYYSGLVYESQISNNTNTPGSDSTWRVISGNVGGVPIGTIIDFAGQVIPQDFLYCDGGAISRTTYVSLLSAITQTQNGITINGNNTLTSLSDTSQMYVGMSIEGSGIPSGTTISSITNSTSLIMSNNATASSTVPVIFFNWGNGDGSTTFNKPDSRRKVCMGSGGSGTSVIGNVVGDIGGEEGHIQQTNEVGVHNHTISYASGGNAVTNGGSGTQGFSIGGGNLTLGTSSTISNTPSPQAMNIIQPSMIVMKVIKYQ